MEKNMDGKIRVVHLFDSGEITTSRMTPAEFIEHQSFLVVRDTAKMLDSGLSRSQVIEKIKEFGWAEEPEIIAELLEEVDKFRAQRASGL